MDSNEMITLLNQILDEKIGMVTAYAYAKSKGYSGSADDFANDMANIGVNISAIETAINTFNNQTVPNAETAITTAGSNQVTAVNTAGQEQLQNVTAEGGRQVGLVTAAGTAQTEVVNNAGTTQTNAVNTAGSTQVSNVNNAGSQQITAIQQKGEETRQSIPSDYTNLTNEVNDLETALDFVDETVTSVNVFNGVYTAVLPPSSASGSDSANANNKTTDFIPANYGDKIYCGYTGDADSPMTTYNPVFVTEYDENKQWLYRSSQYPATDDANNKKTYTVTQANTKFVRVSFANSMVTTTGRLFEIAVNIDTSGYIYYSSYVAPYEVHDAMRIKHLEDVVYGVNMKLIDCWGDSRIEMIANQGTSVCDYLQTTLGNGYNVCNYGISSQSSGMCAARLGSNEVFVTLTNNQIPASGEVQLTDIKCSTGNIKNMYAFSDTAYIPCAINGVRGRLSRASQSDYTKVKFLRDSDGAVISVKPRTKIVVDDMRSRHHICVLWWGKNDFASAVPYVESGILDNYDKAVKYLGHDKFVILGETCSITESYETGGTNRTYLDNINNSLAEKYPDNYIDINAYLSSEQALTDVGLTATATDLEYIAKGFPCYQLMVYSTDTSDTAHPNAKGREAIAHKLYTWMQDKGWV